MAVHRIKALAMVDDDHVTVAGKWVGIGNPAALHRLDRIARRRIDIDTLADDLGGEFRMFEFAVRRAYVASDRPLKAATLRVKTASSRRRRRRIARFHHSAARQ